MSVVFAKLLGVLVELLVLGENIFAHWFTYLTIVSWLFFMIIWLNRLNAALGLYDPIIIIPLLQANFIFWTSVSGGIYFQEFPEIGELLTGQTIPAAGAWVGYVCGIMLMFYGIYNICPQPESEENENLISGCVFLPARLRCVPRIHAPELAGKIMGVLMIRNRNWNLHRRKVALARKT